MIIKKGDNVIVISGKDKGLEGKVVKAFPKECRIIVEGVNIRKRSQKPRQQGGKGQIVEFAAPIHVSNAMLIDPKTKKRTRVGMKIEGRVKKRVTKKSGTVI